MKRPSTEAMSLITLDALPNEVIWIIFVQLKQRWIVGEGFSICNRWREIVRTECMLLDSASCGLNRVILQRVPNLRTLNVNSTIYGLTKDDFACLPNLHTFKIEWQSINTMPNIAKDTLINLPDTLLNITAHGVYYLPPLARLSKLHTLSLSYNSVVDDTIIGSLTTLQSLRLSSCTQLTGRCLYALSSLRNLALSAANINDEALYSLVNLTSLEVAWSSAITNQSIRRLTGLRELTLRTVGRDINENSLAGLHLLTRLCVQGRNMTVNYNALTQLKSLSIFTGLPSQSMFNDRHVHILTNLVTLYADDHLLLSSRWLSHFPSLRDLYMDRISIDDTLTEMERSQFTRFESSKLYDNGQRHCLLKK